MNAGTTQRSADECRLKEGFEFMITREGRLWLQAGGTGPDVSDPFREWPPRMKEPNQGTVAFCDFAPELEGSATIRSLRRRPLPESGRNQA